MPAERLSMRQIREVLRLRFASELPQRAIAKSLGLSQGAVSGYLSRARAAGVVWTVGLRHSGTNSVVFRLTVGRRVGTLDSAPLPNGCCISERRNRGMRDFATPSFICHPTPRLYRKDCPSREGR